MTQSLAIKLWRSIRQMHFIYIRGNLCRFGYNLHRAGKYDGTLLHVELYRRSNTMTHDHGLGHGTNIVMEMMYKIESTLSQQVICDNYFGALGLLKERSDKRITLTKKFRENRLFC